MTIQRLLTMTVSFTLLCVLFTLTAFSQTKTVKGKVTDDKGVPIQGATVTVKGSKIGTSTDASGAFTVNVPEGSYALTVSSVGYSEQDVSVVGLTTVNVSLVSTSQSLNDVVVIGYGTARKKKDLTGAISSVSAKDFNTGAVAAPDQLLVNKVPGVEISTSSGQPGSATTIRVRGTNSILNTGNPLIVIDGVELDGRDATAALSLGGSLGLGTTPASNPLTYINPYDVQQIEVLKDASASAIYGSGGANGVIVITTKKASAGPVKLELGTSWGDNVGYMKTDDLMNASQFRKRLTQYNLTANDEGSSVNALKAIEQHNVSQLYNVSLSGGNDNGRFKSSFLGSNAEGLIKSSYLTKYLGTLGGTYKFLDKRVTIDFNLIVGHTQQSQPLISNTPGAGGNLMQWVLNWNPTQAFYTNGQLNLLENNVPNPLAAIQAYSDQSYVTTVLGNISANVEILHNLNYKFMYALNDGSGTRYTNIDGWLQGVQGISGVGVGVIGNANLNSQTLTHTLDYKVDLTNSLNLDAIAGYEYWTTNYRDQALLGTGFDINNTLATSVGIPNTSQMEDAANSLQLTPANPSNPSVDIQSYFARVVFNLSDKYYLTGTFRADGSNKFGADNKYGYFLSVAGRWVLSNENFLKGSFFSNLALRASWGITGDQGFPAGAAQAIFTLPSNATIGQINVPNPNLKWQQTKTTDIGLDYGLFNNRVYGAIDYYHKNTSQLIYETTGAEPIPEASEFINLPANLINSGIEFSVGADIIDHPNFTWSAMFNISYNHNELTNFGEPTIPTGEINGNGVSGDLAQVITNGQPLNEFYLPHFVGFTQAGGDSVTSTSHYAGDPNPHVLLGFSNTLKYKNFSLVLNFGGTMGYKVFNNTALAVTNIYSFSKGLNTSNHVFVQGQAVGAALQVSDRYVENANFLKLRNAQLAYAFGDIGKYIKNLNVFVNGNNLFIITKFTGFDPEVNIDKSTTNQAGQAEYPSRSMEYLPYPTPRIFSAGLNVSL